MPADAGIRFGQYVLLRRIARGGMAEVFLAQQQGLEGFDRRVAVKRILPHLADAPDFVKMFLSEARLAAQLAHPNVVHIYEFGKVANDYFIAMEFVEGVHAGQVFRQAETEKIPPTLVARIGADAASALHYAHELRAPNGKSYGLVHRDVSPANIMISFDGIVKLCDFGIAKAAAAGDQLTNPGQVKGKYAYMSPEQTTASPLDGRSDVFALGIVLWELLAGKYIVPRGDAVQAMRMIRDGKLEPLERAAPDVPPPLAKAVQAALETKRENRATAADLATALEAFIKASPDIATPMQLASWLRPRFPRESYMQLAVSTGPGTQAAPGTQAGDPSNPGTAAISDSMLVTPTPTPTVLPPTPAMVPHQRRVHKVIEDHREGTEIYVTSDLDDGATVRAERFRAPMNTPSSAPTMIAPQDDATVHAGPPIMMGGDPTAVVDARHLPHPPDEEDSGHPTFLAPPERDRRKPMTGAPPVAATRMMPPAPGTHGPSSASLPSPSHGTHGPSAASLPSPARGVSLSPESRTKGTLKGAGKPGAQPRKQSQPKLTPSPRSRTMLTSDEAARLRRRRMIITIGALGGLMLVSFLIALAASGGGKSGGAFQKDAAAPTIDASVPAEQPPIDAAPVLEPTVPVDAAAAASTGIIVRTVPEGGTITVGTETRAVSQEPGESAATARFAVAPGSIVVRAVLDGFEPEERDVTVTPGETKTVDITFTRHSGKTGPMGKLSVHTTPWSDVYLDGKKLGQAPFTDLEAPVGAHTLTFRNPTRPTVVKAVTIKAGKPTKLTFNLP